MKRNDGWLNTYNQAFGMGWNRRLAHIRFEIHHVVFIFADISGILFAYQCYTLLCYQNPTMS